MRSCETSSRWLARHLKVVPLLRQPSVNAHAEASPTMTAFLKGLTPRMAQLTGCDLLPTNAYFGMDLKGGLCRVHTGRPACEHSVSLTLAASGDAVWALSVGTADAGHARLRDDFEGAPYASIPMPPGDALLYRGIDRRHGRVDPNPNLWSAHLFLHWVDAAGTHREHAFDRFRSAHGADAAT